VCQGVEAHDRSGLAALEAARSAPRVYEAGDIICGQGDSSDYIFNLISGWVETHRDMADGRRQIVEFLQPGAIFGVDLPDEELSQTATAITKTVVCPIKVSKFDELRRRFPEINEQYISLLLREKRSLVTTLTRVSQGSAKERIGGLLWNLAVTAAGEGVFRPGAAIPMPLTQRHIAEATGLTSIHVNRVLRQLREEQVLELHDGKLVALNAKKLRAIAEPGADWTAAASPLRLGSAEESAPREATAPTWLRRSGPGAVGCG
jgi:CRP-like cAMP-binding protein